MVANEQAPICAIQRDVTMTHVQDVTLSSALECPHCDFKCNCTSIMTQHSWEKHPLLMRRKKHLISSTKTDNCDETLKTFESIENKNLPAVTETAQEMQNCKLSVEGTNVQSVQAQTEYRERAVRSLSLLSTAAAILENQATQPQERQPPTEKPLDENQHPYQLESTQPVYAPVYKAYIPSLDQYVAIPFPVGPSMINPNSYLNSQRCNIANNNFACQSTFSYYAMPPQQQQQQSPPSSNKKQATDEIRNLLKASAQQVHLQRMSDPTKVTPYQTQKPSRIEKKTQKSKTAAVMSSQCPLGEQRHKELQEAIMSTDYCDINDFSTTTPFKCPDGVWRMVKFKCIKGLWVVQTPNSNTPTVYVPCDKERIKENPSRDIAKKDKIGQKRKSNNTLADVDAKRSCASAPIPDTMHNSPRAPLLKRTLSNPLIATSLPPPSQQFTNNEGKKVNISMIKHSSSSGSCDLLRSLLLRKPSPPLVTSPSSPSSSSSEEGKLSCIRESSKQRPLAGTFTKTLLESSMAF